MTNTAKSTAARYVLGVLMVALALAVARLLPIVPAPTPLFFAAVLVAAWYGGLGPGLLATALASFVMDYVQRPAHWPRPDWEHAERLLLFAVLAALAAWHQASRQKALAWEHAAHLESRRAMDQKDHFLALLGHELRSPLGALSGALATSRRRAGDAATLAWLQGVLERQVSHMTGLTEELLDVSRIGRGKLSLRRERVDLNALFRSEADDTRNALEPAGLSLHLDVPSDPVWVDGDPVRLRQVAANLLGNAIKFTDPGGSISVRVRKLPNEANAEVIVQDTGIGISPDLMDHLFEAYVQGNALTAGRRGGLGLGLALAKGIIDLHGGTITAVSEGPAKGTTMTVVLPLGVPSEEKFSHEAPQGCSVFLGMGKHSFHDSTARRET